MRTIISPSSVFTSFTPKCWLMYSAHGSTQWINSDACVRVFIFFQAPFKTANRWSSGGAHLDNLIPSRRNSWPFVMPSLSLMARMCTILLPRVDMKDFGNVDRIDWNNNPLKKRAFHNFNFERGRCAWMVANSHLFFFSWHLVSTSSRSVSVARSASECIIQSNAGEYRPKYSPQSIRWRAKSTRVPPSNI